MGFRVQAEFTGNGTLIRSFDSREAAEEIGDLLRDQGWAAVAGPLTPSGFYLYVVRMTRDELKALGKDLGLELIDRRHRSSLRACG
jgi:hypothetical protein